MCATTTTTDTTSTSTTIMIVVYKNISNVKVEGFECAI